MPVLAISAGMFTVFFMLINVTNISWLLSISGKRAHIQKEKETFLIFIFLRQFLLIIYFG